MKILAVIAFLSSLSAYAVDPNVQVEITSLTNVNNSSALEACGTAKHAAGLKPILVTVQHGGSKYTTLTSADGDWCVVIKRWTFNGKSEADGVALKDVMGN